MKRAFLIYIFALLCAGCESKGATTVQTNNPETRTFCVGRHLIDLPAAFELGGISAIFTPPGVDGDGSSLDVTIDAGSLTQERFLALVKERRAAIVAAADDTTGILKEEKSLPGNAVLFRILRIEESYTSELHLLKSDRYLKIRTKSYHNHFLEAENRLATFAKNISLMTPGSIPPSGFCLGPVFVSGVHESEYLTMLFRDNRRPDIVISVQMNTYRPDESQTLLERVSGPTSLLTLFNAGNKVLRKGELQVAGMRAQEWLSWIKLGENRDEKHLGFALETMRPTPGPMQPHIRLELDTGEHDSDGVERPNSLSDQDAIALWDSIVKTIRLRPVANQ